MSSTYHLTQKEIEEEYECIVNARTDIKHFSRLYDRYFEQIFNFIIRRVGNEHDAGELASNTFYNAMINLKTYEFRGLPFSAWLYRIAINEVNKFFNQNRSRDQFEVEEEDFKVVLNQYVPDIHEEKISRILEILEDLPRDMLEILELRFFEEKSFSEISYILNIGESAAKMRTYRALDRIRAVLKNGGKE